MRPPTSKANPIILAAQFRVKHSGTFNTKELYLMVHEWVKDKQWRDMQDNTDGDHHESFYMDRTDIYGAKEVWTWWRLWQYPDAGDDADNPFYKFHLDIDMHFFHVRETEIMHENKKIKTHNGEVEFRIWAWIEVDVDGKWSNHPFLRLMLDIFRLRLFETALDKHKYKLYREAYILQGMIKKFLQMRGFLPQLDSEQFHVPRTIPTVPTGA